MPVTRTIRLTSIFLLIVGIVDLGASFQNFQAANSPNLWFFAALAGFATLVLAIMAFLAVFLVWVRRVSAWIVPLTLVPTGASVLEAFALLTIQGVPMLYDLFLLLWIVISAIPIGGIVLSFRSNASRHLNGPKPPSSVQ